MATITLHPSQVVAEESTYEQASATHPLSAAIGKGKANTTYAEWYMTKGAAARTRVVYGFDTSGIPSDATIRSVTVTAKCQAENDKMTRGGNTSVLIVSGGSVIAQSENQAFGTSPTLVTLTASMSRTQLNDVGVRIAAVRGALGVSTQYWIRFYGADLVVEYETGATPQPPEPEPEPTPTDKTHATLIGGTTYSVLGGRASVDGTGVDIKGGRALINGTGVDILFGAGGAGDYAPTFEDNTWEQIIDACQRNAVPDTWVAGNNKLMTIGGTEYLIDIIGKGHDTYASGGKAPLTFQMHDCHTERKSMENGNSNSNGWQDCAMRKTHLPDFLIQMPTKVQASIREVNKLTSEGAQSDYILTTADKLFLLSEIEIFGKAVYSARGEGTQYQYYAEGGSAIKNRDGSAADWGERSPKVSDIASYCRVFSNGQNYSGGASGLVGVPFAFCF